ncbi:MAG: site-specific integrase [Lactobacillus sp.]|jgi:integrase|nr:site-specific integrase [Lactobacillus sp.]
MQNDQIKSYTTSNGEKRYKLNIYVGRDELTGKPKQVRKQGFKTYKAAEKAYFQLQLRIANGDLSAKRQKHFKFKDVYQQWLSIYSGTVKESTLWTSTWRTAKYVIPAFGDYYIDKINLPMCQKIVNSWFKAMPATYGKNICLTRQVFEYAIRLGLIDNDPMDKVLRPKTNRRKRSYEFYTKDELNAFLKAAKKDSYKRYTYFRVLAYAGLRRGEGCALKWKDIDFAKGTLSVKRTLTAGMKGKQIVQSPKTPTSNRTISLDQATLSVLKHWQLLQAKQLQAATLNLDQYVFDGFRGEYAANVPISSSTVETWNKEICQRGHIRHINIHGFRHTHASLLFEAGVPMEQVKDRLGHSTIKTTLDVYTHVYQKSKPKVAKQFAKYMQS